MRGLRIKLAIWLLPKDRRDYIHDALKLKIRADLGLVEVNTRASHPTRGEEG